jgi:prolipoprotein diacylglyceryltransferase
VLLNWGVRALPAERWQMLAAVPVSRSDDGSWQGVNLTFYGFFSASGTVFGFAMMLLLLASVGIPSALAGALAVALLAICIPASRLVAAWVERKRNTFTVAGAAFAASLLFPPLVLWLRPLLARFTHQPVPVLPLLAAAAISYALGESVGRLACLSFGCCYGLPLREARPAVARLFRKHHLVLYGDTKKASYASGLAGEPLIPVQSLTSAVFAIAGIAGLSLFLLQHFRLAALVPAMATWGWRACAERLRADDRGRHPLSIYQMMAAASILYLAVFVAILPAGWAPQPHLAMALAQVSSSAVVVPLEGLWIALFVYYGKSRVTASNLSFHLVRERL